MCVPIVPKATLLKDVLTGGVDQSCKHVYVCVIKTSPTLGKELRIKTKYLTSSTSEQILPLPRIYLSVTVLSIIDKFSRVNFWSHHRDAHPYLSQFLKEKKIQQLFKSHYGNGGQGEITWYIELPPYI